MLMCMASQLLYEEQEKSIGKNKRTSKKLSPQELKNMTKETYEQYLQENM